jgi:serine protease Do
VLCRLLSPLVSVVAAELLFVLILTPLGHGQDGQFTEQQMARVTPVVRAALLVSPSVVSIYQDVLEEVQLPWPQSVLRPEARARSRSLGSGVVIDPDGFILTNDHVITHPDHEIRVHFKNGASYRARLVNTDPGNDIALLKVTPDGPLATARLGSSSDLMVGETVIAIGNPLNNENSVTLGIVSSLYRDVSVPGSGSGQRFRDFIQLDAAINPGNSGGPLVNIKGEIIGINWTIRTDAEGIGFAIPIDRVRDSLINTLLNPQVVNEVVSGLEIEGDRTGRHVALSHVEDESPGQRAGLRRGDLLLSVNGQAVQWEFDFNKALYGSAPGDRLPISVQRGGQRIDTILVLEAEETPMSYIQARTGLRVVDHPRYFGVFVESVDPRGQASKLPIVRGDLIDGAGGVTIDDIQGFYRILRNRSPGQVLEFQGFRGRIPMKGSLRLD